jgi:hypothetical protein
MNVSSGLIDGHQTHIHRLDHWLAGVREARRAGGVGVRAGPNSGRAQAAGKGRGDPGAAALPGPPPDWCLLMPPSALA